jgi:hypothetical protein
MTSTRVNHELFAAVLLLVGAHAHRHGWDQPGRLVAICDRGWGSSRGGGTSVVTVRALRSTVRRSAGKASSDG